MPSNKLLVEVDKLFDMTNADMIARLHLNKELRTGKPSYYRTAGYKEVNLDKTRRQLNRLISNAKVLDKDILLYRGVKSGFEKLNIGDSFINRGFTYLTSNKTLAQKYGGKNGVVIRIILPKGTRIGKGEEDQQEYILPMNTSFIKTSSSSMKLGEDNAKQ